MIRLRNKKMWRLRGGLEEAIRRGNLSGMQMERLVGHITWAALIFRPALALVSPL